jgi:hypothetical protein
LKNEEEGKHETMQVAGLHTQQHLV